MRTIDTTPTFQTELAEMRGAYPRVDFAISGIESSLQSRPQTFHVIIGKDIRVAKLIAFAGVPDATIYFSFDDTNVWLLSIRLN